ncbi:MAG TPA: hypothetical protein DCF44_00800 [Chitinophagaceae bacterium]|nr:hypothetical protein [Chitinophagaceae bacterium]
MKRFILENIFTIMGVILGAMSGYLYWKFVGCSSGTCAITSRPLNSTLYGAVMGGLLLNNIKSNKKQKA